FDNNVAGDPERYTTMVGSSKAKGFPIIVNYCEDQKVVEFNFSTGEPYKMNTTKRMIKTKRQTVSNDTVHIQHNR
ncbi:MAG TPA: hypothetical protein VK718_03660, partial [Ferruginibacter sp.]|nr:hypothetical protein [Ferruginibacter sp.]